MILSDGKRLEDIEFVEDITLNVSHPSRCLPRMTNTFVAFPLYIQDTKDLQRTRSVIDIVAVLRASSQTAPAGDESGVAETTHLPYRYLKCDGNVGVTGDDGGGGPLLAPGLLEYMRSDDPFF